MSSKKTIRTEIDQHKARAILQSERENLGLRLMQYQGEEHLQFLIDEQTAEVEKWEGIYKFLATK